MSADVAEQTDASALAPVAEDASINPKAKPGTLHQVDPRSLVIIGLDTDDGASHPLYDERIRYDLREALVASVAAKGVLSPIHVRIEDGKAVVLDGRQRVRAAREVAARLAAEGAAVGVRVPVIVIAAKKAATAAFHSVALNALRQADSFAVTARKAAHLFTICKSVAEVAQAFGISEPIAKKLIDFGENASDALVEAVSDGTISATAGVALAAQSEAAQEAAVAEARAPVAEDAAAQGVSEGKAKKARGLGERGRPTGKASKGVKHSVGRKLLKKGAEACPDENALALLRWIFEGSTLPKTHPLAKWVGSTMKLLAEKGTPGRKPAAAPAAPKPEKAEKAPKAEKAEKPEKAPKAEKAPAAVAGPKGKKDAAAAPVAPAVVAPVAAVEDEDSALDEDLEEMLAAALAAGVEDADADEDGEDDGDEDSANYDDDEDGDEDDGDEDDDDLDDLDEDDDDGEE